MTFSSAELERYDRQIRIEGLGKSGQSKLKKASVIVVGAGGLGCPTSFYLVAAGVGYVAVVDKETVELSNLNRQILHWSNDIGRPKSVSMVEKLRQLNPEVTVKALQKIVTTHNARQLVKDFAVVVDALDNWRTRFLLNKACVKEKIPFVHAGVHALYGQITTILPGKGPCLQCILPKIPPEEEKFPVLGAAVGTLGLLEALETIKIITGLGEPLVGRMLHFDAETMSFQEIKVERRRNCPVCGSL
ncbi:MAG: HesA/MoeB/ThiF family protein [Candidatus Bathyarchaeota archaeon]|nr:HesA/MoeB/ThiF family protein [Dehalococcoidia bacterium]MDH5419959.1 HesA/MoeB/ThiF family protein [Candidatus Bathyarchaeota archaeon]MDH5623324.1 HesA/MoeB/ThiF family protein [Candidatus Bathyarchaeota archaeon]MDH5636608.1 HesA/MoeB/ThiF family protein [Candidatus Bathyarchaeota archaeon]MDH5701959.1 HesA/MoeB/ThiF family protein [Candidatus Bathyarchaeota archaeon]